ncbi:hypothetical protein ACFQVC_01215 [Streptomyces monticola]|uniref:Bacterial Ig-like domain-containing protein n=1 Tax=Streptomyces monticola TaxID=2666263 RepID=A0ABW2J9Z9_9ACTN
MPARNGARHLVVVFANYTAPDDYGWSNGILDKLRANVLWIRDRFHGQHSYYLCKDMDFGLEDSVARLISTVLGALSLGPENCTAFGSSKGGSAALYFGLRYGLGNIVASVPQFRIGTYVRDDRQETARFMMGESPTVERVRVLDEAIPGLVRAGANRGANIYLVSSSRDEQHGEQVEPFLGLFRAYENFNYICNESPLISGHGQVSLRNVPHLMGLLHLLTEGIAPRFGLVRSGYEEPDRPTADIDAYLKATSLVKRDSEFPPPTISVPAADEEVGGAMTIAGTARGAVRVSLWENGKFLATPDVAADGTWSWQPRKPWGKGQHMVRLFAVDAAGFQSPRTEVSFSVVEGGRTPTRAAAAQQSHPVPTMAPAHPPAAPTVTAPAPHQQVQGAAVAFMGTAHGAAQVALRENGVLLGASAVGPDGSWSWYSGWAWGPGAHLVEVCAVDARGIESTVVPVPVSVVDILAGQTPSPYAAGGSTATYFPQGH